MSLPVDPDEKASALVGRTRVEDPSQVAVARSLAVRHARAAGLRPERVDDVALVATELAENLHRHAVGGEMLVRRTAAGSSGRRELTVLAVDRGPGVERFERCLRDGYSTVGTMGTGLGAVRRIADRFDAVSEPGRGTVVLAGFGPDPRPGLSAGPPAAPPVDPWFPFDVGAVGFPIESESENGDGWSAHRRGSTMTVMLADGLGHGPHAAVASAAATAGLAEVPGRAPAEVITHVNRRIAGTRGAAVSVAGLGIAAATEGGEVRSAGLGNVSILVASVDGVTHRLATSHGTAGARAVAPAIEQRDDFPAGGVLVLHSDGLSSRWTLDGRARLLAHHADTIAAALWRDHVRGTDDSLVVVLKAAGDE